MNLLPKEIQHQMNHGDGEKYQELVISDLKILYHVNYLTDKTINYVDLNRSIGTLFIYILYYFPNVNII